MVLNERASKKISGETIKPKKKIQNAKIQQNERKAKKNIANLSLPYNKFLYSKLFIVQLRNEYKICVAMDIHMSTQIKKALSRTLPSYLTSQNVVHSWRERTTKKKSKYHTNPSNTIMNLCTNLTMTMLQSC